MEEKDPLDKFGGRKFIFAMYAEVVATVFTFMSLMTVDQWLVFTGSVGMAYFGINVTQKRLLK